ncbi:MAG: transporter related protein [Gemmatimonadetes bacterium]|nr:transporter related protein [Gemmatimonadota bacterium]
MVDALILVDIEKRFGAVHALRGASLRVRAGTVHAVLGENGAGKSTLLRIAFGMYAADAGRMEHEGQPYAPAAPRDAIARGLGMVHQHFTQVPAMTVAENVALGGRGRFSRRGAEERVRTLSVAAGLPLDPAARVAALPVGGQQRLEIVKSLAHDARLLILDEPTAVLSPGEADDLLRWLRHFADAGHSVVLVTHKVPEALAYADDVTVLRGGRTVLETAASRTSAGALVAALMGAEPVAPAVSNGKPRGPLLVDAASLQVRDASGALRVRDASLQLHAGEIVGIAAVEGSGHHALLRAVAGRVPVERGTLRAPAGVGFVPEDRHRDALVLAMSLTENLALRDAGHRTGMMDWPAIASDAASLLSDHDVRAQDTTVEARTLSGGNQQKFVLGRELAARPEVLVVENPTRGLDVNATAAVHARLRAAASEGVGLLLYSSDVDEVLALADRVYVMHAGVLAACPLDRAAVSAAMLSGGS